MNSQSRKPGGPCLYPLCLCVQGFYFLFVLLVICKLVELFCVFFTEFHVPFFLVALSLLLKHSGRRNKNTDLQISVLRAESWCLTSASRPDGFSAPACMSKKTVKSVGHRGRHLLAVQRAKDRSFHTTSAGQEETRGGPWAKPLCWGKGLGSSLGQMSREGWMGKPGKGAPCLHGPTGQIAHVGGLQLLFRQAGLHPGGHLNMYLYILTE